MSSVPIPTGTGAVPFPGEERSTPRLTGAVVGRVLALFFTSRLLILAAAFLSRNSLLRGPYDDHFGSLARSFVRWDAGWYLRIVAEGYTYDPQAQSTVAFYPLFPLLIRGFSLLGLDPMLAGYAISNLSLVGACFLLWRLAALETGSERAADGSVLFLLFYPGAVWCSMIYTESLFLLLMLGCLLAARRRRWLTVAVLGYFVALTRAPGLLAAAFLGVEAIQQWLDDRRAAVAAGISRRPVFALPDLTGRWRTALGVIAPALGHATYLGFLQWRFGDWRAQQKSFAAGWHIPLFQAPWRVLSDNWTFLEPFFRAVSFTLIGLVAALGVLALFVLRRKGYAVLILLMLALLVTSTNYHDFTRYSTTVVPIYLVLGLVADRLPVLEKPALVFSTMLLTLFTSLLVNGYHIN